MVHLQPFKLPDMLDSPLLAEQVAGATDVMLEIVIDDPRHSIAAGLAGMLSGPSPQMYLHSRGQLDRILQALSGSSIGVVVLGGICAIQALTVSDAVLPLVHVAIPCILSLVGVSSFRCCSCSACATLATQAVRQAHVQVARLFASAEHHKGAAPALWMAVGCCLARIVHASISVLLHTDAHQSATWTAVKQACRLLQVIPHSWAFF